MKTIFFGRVFLADGSPATLHIVHRGYSTAPDSPLQWEPLMYAPTVVKSSVIIEDTHGGRHATH